jgi:hypothetical protein
LDRYDAEGYLRQVMGNVRRKVDNQAMMRIGQERGACDHRLEDTGFPFNTQLRRVIFKGGYQSNQSLGTVGVETVHDQMHLGSVGSDQNFV